MTLQHLDAIAVWVLHEEEFRHQRTVAMAKFFFVQDPDGYRIEVLQRHGRYR